MKINKLIFLKVPFDNSYRNVYSAIKNNGTFEGDSFKTALKDYYTENFPRIEISLPNIKSFRRTDLYASFNVILPNTVEIFSYNYLITINDNDLFFWFITNSTQLNDSGNNVNYTISLENDVWSNFQNSVYNERTSLLVEQTHINQVQKDGDYIIAYNNLNVYPNQISDLDYEIELNSFSGFRVLWLNLRYSAQTTKFVYDDTIDGTDRVIDNNSWDDSSREFRYSAGTYRDVFIPYMCYQNSLDNPISLRHCQIKTANGTFNVSNFDINLSEATEDIVEARFTFHIPTYCTVYIAAPDSQLVISLPSAFYGELEDITTSNFRVNCIGADWENHPQDYQGQVVISVEESKPPEFRVNKTEFDIDELFTSNRFIQNTPLLNRYPFVKRTIYMGNKTFPIIEKMFDEQFQVYVKPSCSGIKCYISGGRGGNNYYNNIQKPTLIEANTSVPVTASQIDIYMRNNGNRLNVDYQTQLAQNQTNSSKISADFSIETMRNTINAVGAVASGVVSAFNVDKQKAVSGVVSSLTSLAQTAVSQDQAVVDFNYKKNLNEIERSYITDYHSALISDLSNAKKIQTVSSNGELDILYQDNVFMITENISKDFYTNKNFNALKNVNMYGFVVNSYMKINSFPMRNFVYLKTVASCLTSNINLLVKRKLEEILDNGVRCWRISATNDYVKNMDTRVSNYFNTGAI